MFLILYFSWLEKEIKKQFKSQSSPRLLKIFSPTLPTISTSPTISFRYFLQPPPPSPSHTIPHPPSIRELRVFVKIIKM